MSGDWDTYFCQVDGRPASILVDLAVAREAPLKRCEHFVYLRLAMRSPRDDGLSSRDEYARLIEVEESLAAACAETELPIAYVGRCTGNGCRDFFFYAENPVEAEQALSRAMVPFPEYEFETGANGDPGWEAYFEFLYPSPEQYQMILNGRTLRSLAEHGDRHEIEREVAHWLYFASAEDRDRFRREAEQQGYRTVKDSQAEGERPFGLTVARSHPVEYPTINQVVLELYALARECSGEYDGWETSVERGEGGPDEPGEAD